VLLIPLVTGSRPVAGSNVGLEPRGSYAALRPGARPTNGCPPPEGRARPFRVDFSGRLPGRRS
jgi:hypothetical protein